MDDFSESAPLVPPAPDTLLPGRAGSTVLIYKWA